MRQHRRLPDQHPTAEGLSTWLHIIVVAGGAFAEAAVSFDWHCAAKAIVRFGSRPYRLAEFCRFVAGHIENSLSHLTG